MEIENTESLGLPRIQISSYGQLSIGFSAEVPQPVQLP